MDGHETRFWRDKWILGCDRLDFILSNAIPHSESEFPVSFYGTHGSWIWGIIIRNVPDYICNMIARIPLPSPVSFYGTHGSSQKMIDSTT